MVKKSDPLYPLIGIGVVVWRDNKILLVKRKNPPMQNQWALPGGKQQWGETIFSGAAREVREETGVEIAPLDIITALDAMTRDEKNAIQFHYTLVEVSADWISGEGVAADDALDVRWATLDEVEQLCQWLAVAQVARLSLLQRVL